MCVKAREKSRGPGPGGKVLRNERGVALAMILILSAVSLAIMAALVYMMTAEIQTSGIQQRYKTAIEAGRGGAELTYKFIERRGEKNSTDALKNTLTTLGLNAIVKTSDLCSGTSIYSGVVYYGLEAKLNAPSDGATGWGANGNCKGADNTDITTGASWNYDLYYEIGTTAKYRVYTKIVDTTEGNTGGDLGLTKAQVVASSSGEVQVMPVPYLYTVEVQAENKDNPQERARYSILYEY